ncbi:VWA domain-containing protein [Desulforhopalus vacuolatus]|uniref:vWA domain-containing protein n=1 Tax=Desulforhopalus vacuolatus TaxID=40414 RepID=UPI001964918E|nr:vWA domain-containing protein [Desulforhopalus vacuolatus]MBM9519416.1 VWA domain-containing protein [Desulforhopalus vacuolatus]
MLKKSQLFLPLLLAAALIVASPITGFAENRVPVKLAGKKVLPLQVLTKPYSTIYAEQDEKSAVVRDNLPAFQPFYVYTTPNPGDREMETGWYEVGSDNHGTVVGWMKQDDVFEWKQALCLAYTLPLGRKPVLMFDSLGYIKELAGKEKDVRIDQTASLYKTIDSGAVPSNFPVKSVEPKKAVDISKEFYLLPILDYQVIDIGPMEGRLVQLAAVTNAGAGAREKSDIRTNSDYLAGASSSVSEVTKKTLQKINFDVVWVVDTTSSMQPYIDQALAIIKQVSETLGSEELAKQSLNFGIWGYRDSERDINGIGYTTHNYTPQLQGVDDFVKTLQNVKVTQVGSVDYPEDLFSGVTEGITHTAWTPGAVRFMVILADAPSHKAGHKWNLSGNEENSLHGLARDRKVNITAIHLKNPRASRFNPLAEQQLSVLATKGSSDEMAYMPVDSTDMEAFSQVTSELANGLSQSLVSFKKKAAENIEKVATTTPPSATPIAGDKMAVLDTLPSGPADISSENGEMADLDPLNVNVDLDEITTQSSDGNTIVASMVKAAMVEWLGSSEQAKAPRDVVAWAVDKDLEDPGITSMEVRLLINKQQLDTLYTMLKSVLTAGRRGQISGDDFFNTLQATAATTARDPELLKKAESIASSGLIPEFLEGLPYHSRLMDMNSELWSSWSVDEQDEFLNNLEALIEAYKIIHDSPEGWIQLNPGDDTDQNVYPLALEMLP